ncbi:filamentous hemagglutinin outer membrane protein [Calothrix sp. NIES-4071]|nr:filamentous hemagglutinin outer membrane protein [Calothrix sp. NIES-4071]BAZ58644.1 filamentous hemagglutinin outer membrane protein [Calothrix sp. NIES-4105]
MLKMTRYKRFWRPKSGLGSLLAFGGVIVSTNCALAQQSNIVPDNTLGALSSVVTPNVDINGIKSEQISGGASRGINLFHSFQEFNIKDGHGAYFTNPTGVENILSRVTGGNASSILGKLGVLGNANLFLINPSGIIFGQNASLDVRGSFVGTTANAIGLSNGDIFSANPGEPLPTGLLNVNPNAFFFNQIAAQPITVNSRRYIGNRFGSPDPFNAFNSYQGLKVPDSKSLLLLGGNVSLDGGILQALGGRVELGGVIGLGTVGLVVDSSNLSLSFPDVVQRADVSLTNMAVVDVIAGGGGSIAVNARNLDILGVSKLLAGIGKGNGSVDSQAGDITLNATGAITIGQSDYSSTIENNVNSNAIGNGGNINIQAGSLSMTDNAVLSTSTAGQGNAGSISVQVKGAVDLIDNSYIDSSASSFAMGNGGNIQIKAGSLLMDRARLSASTTRTQTRGMPSGQGNGGSISVQVEGEVDLIHSSIDSIVGFGVVGNGGNIQIMAESLSMTDEAIVSTRIEGQGNAGNISVQVEDEVSLTTSYINSFVNFLGKNFSAVGKGGDIQIKAGSLTMNADPRLRTMSGASISASTLGTGNAGSISMQVEDKVSLSGNSFISSDVGYNALGNGGDINIKARSLSMTDGTGLTSRTEGKGNAGDIFVQVENEVSLKNNSIDSNVSTPSAVGDAGNIQIKARSILMTDGAKLNTSTQGQGDAGNIEINADDSVSISGFNPEVKLLSSGLFTSTEERAIGQGGDISITTGILRLSDGAVLNARTRNDASGGNITVKTNTLDLIGGGQILTSTFSSGSAGNITVNASDHVNISGSDRTYATRLEEFGEARVDPDGLNSGLFARVRGNATANAGKVEVNAGSIRLDKQGTITTETTSGEGGDIILNVRDILLLRNNSSITATAGTAQQGGKGGNITINTPNGFIVARPTENSDITANAYTGKGGRVGITAFGIYGTQFREKENPQTNDITASSTFGINGTVEVNTPDIDPNRGLINLLVVPVDTDVAQVCSAGGTTAQSRFTITGRGGLPSNPSESLSTDAVQVDLVTLNPKFKQPSNTISTSAISPAPIPIVEATRWVKNTRGEIVLTATPTRAQHSSWQKTDDCRVLNQRQK